MLRVLRLFRRRKPFVYHGPLLESYHHHEVHIARKRAGRRRSLPLREIGFLLLAFLAFKVFLFLDLGPVAYGEYVQDMSQGGPVSQFLGRAMALDPLTEWALMTLEAARA